MIAQSKEKLAAIAATRGKILLRYNFQATTLQTQDGHDQAGYTFEEVRINPPLTRAAAIDAIISSRYTKADEIALINNKDLDKQGATKYSDYQAFRAQAKSWVDTALAEPAFSRITK